MTAAVGPDSMIRTGNSAAVSTDVTPPLESIMKSLPLKPTDPNLPANLERYLPVKGFT
jgi:hypothetical protein